MILFLGDIHGSFETLARSQEIVERVGAQAVIQVGDFGLFSSNEKDFYEIVQNFRIPTFFIDGNHDDTDRWCNVQKIQRVFENLPLFYIPRGTVMELDNRQIAFMGGAGSIDKKIRIENKMYWRETENISQVDIDKFYENTYGKTIDIFVTHCPPSSVVKKHFDKSRFSEFQVNTNWQDENELVIEQLWKDIGSPMIISGHMHTRVIGKNYRILDIGEMEAL